ILGTDQKEYGPVSAEQLTQWIKEGRANAQTLVQAEGATDWKPLSACPEFAAALGAAPAPPPSGAPPPSITPSAGDGREAARQAVKGPAIGLMVTAILGLIGAAGGVVMNLFVSSMHQVGDPQM